MANTRTARAIAAAAALPFAVTVLSGVAQADNGGFADHGSNSLVTSQGGTEIGGTNNGNSTTGQLVANGAGAATPNSTASVSGDGFTHVYQTNATLNFGGDKG
ncbi:hypothetical protein [Streptomyces sp. NBRC 110611]|uniref:hypothetical protein n=1 Tax=Streptomyces sp. NBRC 110611 TaxID=1621259 RepID=UPI000835A6DF|nr:hypothetical protein [Streptomyces sp. NBRC 110611]